MTGSLREAVEGLDAALEDDDLDKLLARVRELVRAARAAMDYEAPFQPGQPDPTPELDDIEIRLGVGQCGAKDPDGTGARCTWPDEHPERWSHVAGDGKIIRAVF